MTWASRPVCCEDRKGKLVGRFISESDAARYFNITPAAIRMNILGKSKWCQGMRFYHYDGLVEPLADKISKLIKL